MSSDDASRATLDGRMAVVRVLPRPERVQTLLAAFDGIDEAGGAVSDIIAAGIVPAAVEIMDALTIQAVEAAYAPIQTTTHSVRAVSPYDRQGAGCSTSASTTTW